MAYLNTHARTTSPTSNDKFQPVGRTTALFGVFVGFVKDSQDIQRNGRLRVWVPELGSAPDNPDGWIIVNYCSPFAGATNNETTSKADIESFEGTQTSYGFWMVPPDVNNQVLVMFVNGDASRGIWIGSLYNQYMNNMVPGMASDIKNWQYPGKSIPVAEYNKWDTKVTQPDRAFHPYEKTKFKGLGNQGLITDTSRGITQSSARRESPSSVFGILTPGPVIDSSAKPENIRRKGGSSFIMDDGTSSEYVQLTTKSGAQIRLDETKGFVYLINRDGTAWVQMDQKGNIDIFGAGDISMRAQRDFNVRADRNINIEAGQNIFMKAAKDTKEETTTFTYDVNNLPQTQTIPVWAYKGEGAGDGGSIVMQALNNLQTTAQNSAYLTVIENNLSIAVGNSFTLSTQNGGQDFSSSKSIKMTTNAAFDLATTGDIRVGSNGRLSVVGNTGLDMCAGNGAVGITSALIVNGGVTAAGYGIGGGASAPDPALSASPAQLAEVKPLNSKTNILATWSDPESKFRRNSQAIKTTLSRLATYEPCPEHETFSPAAINSAPPELTEADKTYAGSSGAGNNETTAPVSNTTIGANNTSVMPDSDVVDNFSRDINLVELKRQLTLHEGIEYKSYIDTSGLLHAGIGHLLRQDEIVLYPLGSPVSAEQIDLWYNQDSASAIKIAQNLIGDVWSNFSDVRKRAITDLAYNLGRTRLSGFKLFLSACKREDFKEAGRELRNSQWFTQVGRRGPNIITMIVQDVDATVGSSTKKIKG